MPLPPMSFSAGGGRPSGSSSNAGVQTASSSAFNHDGSGWVINFGAGNTVSASGNRDANQATLGADGAGGGLLPKLDAKTLVLIGVVVLLVLNSRGSR